MRQLAIAVLGCWLAAAGVAEAQGLAGRPSTYGSFAPNPKPPKPMNGGVASDPFKTPEPYRPHARPAAPFMVAPVAPIAPMKPMSARDEGKPFKPFKGTSIYSDPGFVKPFKPVKMKSVYDR